MNKGQQDYYAKNSAFGNSVAALGFGLKTETTNYKYSTHATNQAAFNYAVSQTKDVKVKSYVGGVFLVPAFPNAPKNEMTTVSILCGADSPGTMKPAEPTYQNGEFSCGKDTTSVTK